MKRLLGFVSDLRMRYKLATDLNFRDLGTSILEGDGGAFLRDVMVPWALCTLCLMSLWRWNGRENSATEKSQEFKGKKVDIIVTEVKN